MDEDFMQANGRTSHGSPYNRVMESHAGYLQRIMEKPKQRTKDSTRPKAGNP